jgi:hypothetical protein
MYIHATCIWYITIRKWSVANRKAPDPYPTYIHTWAGLWLRRLLLQRKTGRCGAPVPGACTGRAGLWLPGLLWEQAGVGPGRDPCTGRCGGCCGCCCCWKGRQVWRLPQARGQAPVWRLHVHRAVYTWLRVYVLSRVWPAGPSIPLGCREGLISPPKHQLAVIHQPVVCGHAHVPAPALHRCWKGCCM